MQWAGKEIRNFQYKSTVKPVITRKSQLEVGFCLKRVSSKPNPSELEATSSAVLCSRGDQREGLDPSNRRRLTDYLRKAGIQTARISTQGWTESNFMLKKGITESCLFWLWCWGERRKICSLRICNKPALMWVWGQVNTTSVVLEPRAGHLFRSGTWWIVPPADWQKKTYTLSDRTQLQSKARRSSIGKVSRSMNSQPKVINTQGNKTLWIRAS